MEYLHGCKNLKLDLKNKKSIAILIIILIASILAVLKITDIIQANKYGYFKRLPDMNVARAGHKTFLLSDGRVLIIGGDKNNTAEIYNPNDNTCTMCKDLSKILHKKSHIILITDEELFIQGSVSKITQSLLYNLKTSEIKELPRMRFNRLYNYIIPLPNKKILIIGGYDKDSNNKNKALMTAEIYDPISNKFYETSKANYPHLNKGSELKSIVLQNNNVLLLDGNRSELFDFKKNKFMKIDDNISGKVVYTGIDKFLTVSYKDKKTERKSTVVLNLYKIDNLKIKKIQSFESVKYRKYNLMSSSFVSYNNKILITGGIRGTSGICSWSGSEAFIYNIDQNKLIKINNMKISRLLHNCINTKDRKIIISGGIGNGSPFETRLVEVFVYN